jgi:SH3-like domain-containing protein
MTQGIEPMMLNALPPKPPSPLLAIALSAAVFANTAPALAQARASDPAVRGMAVPRYVSLKPNRVNLRSGPGTEYPTVWVYKREGLPLEVIKEYEGWRQVRDADGTSGWVLQSLLSGRRTALIDPWDAKPGASPPQVALYASEDEKSNLIAKVEAGVIANVMTCNGKWCWIALDKFKGYIQQKKLWGVYEAEIVK